MPLQSCHFSNQAIDLTLLRSDLALLAVHPAVLGLGLCEKQRRQLLVHDRERLAVRPVGDGEGWTSRPTYRVLLDSSMADPEARNCAKSAWRLWPHKVNPR